MSNYIRVPETVPFYRYGNDAAEREQYSPEETANYLDSLSPKEYNQWVDLVVSKDRDYQEGLSKQELSNFQNQVYQIAKARVLGDYNNRMAFIRNEINTFQRDKKMEINNAFGQQLKDYYFSADPNKKAPPLAPNMSQLNKDINVFKDNIIANNLQDVKHWGTYKLITDQLNNEFRGLTNNLSSHQASGEVQYYKDSYKGEGKGLVEKMKTSPSVNYRDLTNEYYNSVAAGVNQGLLTPQEGQENAVNFSNEAKAVRKDQINQAINPDVGMNPVQNIERANSIIQDNLDQGVLTPQEAYNILGEIKSRSLAVDQNKSLSGIKSMINKNTATAAEIKNQDIKKFIALESIKKGIEPIFDFQTLYENSDSKTRDLVDNQFKEAFMHGKFSVLPPQIRDEILNDPDLASTVLGANTIDKINSLRKQDEVLRKEAKTDPVELVKNQNIIDGVVPIDYSNNDALVTSLANRSYLADKVYAQTDVENTGLTQRELSDLGKRYVNASVTEKRDLVGNIYKAYGDKSDILFKELDKKGYKELGLVGYYYASGNEDTALDVMNGIEAVKNHKGIINTKQVQLGLSGYSGDLPFYLDASTGETKGKILDAATYIYASNMQKSGIIESDKEGVVNQEVLRKSFNEALNGGTLSLGKSTNVEMPYKDASAKDIYNQMDKLSINDVSYIKQIAEHNFKSDEDMRKFLKDDLMWISLGGGKYMIGQSLPKHLDSGLPEIFTNSKTEEPVIIDLRKFMFGANYTDPSKVTGVMPQYIDVFRQLSQSEASAEGWKKLADQWDEQKHQELLNRPKESSLVFDGTPTPENFVMSGENNPVPKQQQSEKFSPEEEQRMINEILRYKAPRSRRKK